MAGKLKKYKMQAYRQGCMKPFMKEMSDVIHALCRFKCKPNYRIRIYERDSENNRKWHLIYSELPKDKVVAEKRMMN